MDELQREAREVRAAAGRMAREGMSLQDVRCAVVPRDEGFICIFEAASEELVREAYRRAGVGFDRISAALGG